MTSDTLFDGYPCDGRVYLVSTLGVQGGFYVCNGEPIYATKIEESVQGSSTTETECLQLKLGTKLKVVEKSSFNKVQWFDMIRLINFQNERELTAFIDLCTMHAKGNTTLSFEDFFYSLNDLFRPPCKQDFINAIGLYGELSLIDAVRKSGIDIDISRYWQLNGEGSKYDFAFDAGNIEVKTTSFQESKVQIKHNQLFNEDTNYLASVRIERVPQGETLEQLASRLAEDKSCFTNLKSQIELNRQLLRVNEKSLGMAYTVRDIRCYFAKDINFFKKLPDRVQNLKYQLDLTDIAWMDLDETLDKILLQ